MIILLIRLLYALLDVFTWILLIYCILTWFPVNQGVIADIRKVLGRVVDPFLDVFRRFIPPIGGMVDISPIIALFVLQFAVRIVVYILSVFI